MFSINRCLLYPVFLSILTVKCKRGMYYDNLLGGSVDVEGLCVPCEFGQYQPNEGKFKCIPCGIGLTTRTRVIQSLFRIYIYIYIYIIWYVTLVSNHCILNILHFEGGNFPKWMPPRMPRWKSTDRWWKLRAMSDWNISKIKLPEVLQGMRTRNNNWIVSA